MASKSCSIFVQLLAVILLVQPTVCLQEVTSMENLRQELLDAGDKLVVVYLWAEWCGPCRTIAPTMEELSMEMQNTVIFLKSNIDYNSNVPQAYGVRSIPTLLFMKNGEMVQRTVGVQPKSDIMDAINILQ